MLQNFSIRTRLAGWYLISVTLIVAGMGMASWWAMRASLYGIIDENLQKRIGNLMQGLSATDVTGMQQQLDMHSGRWVGFGIYRVFTGNRVFIYQTADASRYGLSAPAPMVQPGKISIRNVHSTGGNVRLGAGLVNIGGKNWIIEWGEPLALTEKSLRLFTHLLLFSIPLLIGLGVYLSYTISMQALAPVGLIIRDARSIHSENLSERLSVPKAHDEIYRLSETLNSMLDRIEGSMRRIQQFTADASHELRSPITVIRAATGYCLDRERTREELMEALVRIDREAEHTTQLIDDLLVLARFDAHATPGERTSVDLSAATQDALERIEPLATSKQVRISSNIPLKPVWVKEGLDPVERLVFILVDNAVKYTPQGGEVRVNLTESKDSAVLEVSDNGIGIAADDLPHVFDRFWRADKVRSRQMGGSGLGLSIAQTIVKQCGGSIRAESEVDHGSQFVVQIPLINSELTIAEETIQGLQMQG
jgi:signal transduction histidine kinase